MQNIIKVVAILGVTAALGACAGKTQNDQDVVYVPVQPEPVSTKY
ncbi:hypothetical protein [Jannaschia rubra]|nr:hypothetical protein [Jannaschia rubra]